MFPLPCASTISQGLTSGDTPSTLVLTSSSEQGTQCPLPESFDVQEGFVPNAHGDHLLYSELYGTETLLATSSSSPWLQL
jgi:hypothetical protein